MNTKRLYRSIIGIAVPGGPLLALPEFSNCYVGGNVAQ